MNKSRASVLVIDDEPGLRDMLGYELGIEGFDVETAESGLAAIEAMKRRRFDLAVTDLKMPGMDGVVTVEALRRLDPDIVVIVATGYATVETAVSCLKRGAYDYIQKPYDVAALTLLLERAMEKNHLQGVVALYEASRILLETVQHGRLPSIIVDMASRVLRAEAVGLVVDGMPRPDVDGAKDVPDPVMDALLDVATEASTPVRLPTAEHPLPEAALDAGYRSALVFPLHASSHVLGHLAVLRSADQPSFASSELRRGVVLAGQIALSVENARLYQSLAAKIEELTDTREQLIHTEKLGVAARLAASVAHEVNNPLASVQANLGALRDYSTAVGGLWLAAKEAASYLRAVDPPNGAAQIAERLLGAGWAEDDAPEDTVRDIAEVIDDILDGVHRIADLVAGFSAMSEPSRQSGATEVDLGALLDECLVHVPPPGAGWRIEATTGSRAFVSEEDARTAVRNVLDYVSGRAATRSGAGEPISVSTAATAQGATLAVTDPGLHLSEAERVRILDPRVEVDERAGRTMRLDLGLCLAYQLLRRNDGNLRVDPAGDGTCFSIDLPHRTSKGA